MSEQQSPEDAVRLMQYYKEHPEMRGDAETPIETRANWTNTERPEWRSRIKIPQTQTATTFGTIDHPRRVTNKRGELLAEAERIVNGARNVQYGDPNADFQCTANLWTEYFQRVLARWANSLESAENSTFAFAAQDVAIMMILLKVSRIGWSPEKADHWLDIAGYAACGYDCSPALLENPGASA